MYAEASMLIDIHKHVSVYMYTEASILTNIYKHVKVFTCR